MPSASRRVLIVHEDPTIQSRLREAVTAAPGEWTADACGDLNQGVDQLSRESFDVVVAPPSSRLPNGATLLDEAAHRLPRAVRLVFAESGGRGVLLQAAGPAHQHLSQPSDASTVFGRLARTLALRDLLDAPKLRQLVDRLTGIPSLPSVYVAITAELGQEMVSGRRVGDLIARDPGMTAKVLQLANSPFFGFRVTIADPVHAVQLLGLETVRALVLSLHIFSTLDERIVRRFRLGKVWRHSLATTACARVIADTAGVSPPEAMDAFTAALLHDVGKLILAASLPEDYADVIQLAEGASLPQHEAERQRLDATHAEVAAYLLGLWGLPETVVEAVAWHHAPAACLAPHLGVVGTVHAADAIEHDIHPADLVGRAPGRHEDYLQSLGIAGQYPSWQAACLDASRRDS